MPYRDSKNHLQVVHLGNLTLSGVTPAASDWVDMRGFDSCTFIAVVNTVTDAGTASGFSMEVQDNSDTTAAGAAAVPDAELLGLESALTVTSDAADDSVPATIGYVGNERYARVNVTGTTLTDADVSVIAVLSRAAQQPPSDVGTSVAAT